MHFSAVILAAGKSTRMGRDKAWLEVDGQPLICRQIRLAREVGAAEVFISGRPDCDYSALGCPILQDEFPAAGPLAGIERALAKSNSPLLLVLAVDLARLTPKVLRELLSHCSTALGTIPRVQEQLEPLAAFYPITTHRLAVSQLTAGRNAVRDFAQLCVEQESVRFVDLPADCSTVFANWNSPEDFGK